MLPESLWHEARQVLRTEHIDPRTEELDELLSAQFERAPDVIGFWNRQPLCYPSFDRFRAPVDDVWGLTDRDVRDLWGDAISAVQLKAAMREAGPLMRHAWTAARAYAGWLVCNRDFVREHDRLFADWADPIQQYGLPTFAPADTGLDRFEATTTAPAELTPLIDAFKNFARRWQIAQLIGPYLPLPHPMQYPSCNPALMPGHAQDAMRYIAQPRTMPLFPQDLLPAAMDAAAGRTAAGDHLAGWMAIIAGANSATTATMARYARLFPLRHYWHVLHDRYPEACHHRKGKLFDVFARHFDVGPETIRKDLQLIGRQLGADWYRSPA